MKNRKGWGDWLFQHSASWRQVNNGVPEWFEQTHYGSAKNCKKCAAKKGEGAYLNQGMTLASPLLMATLLIIFLLCVGILYFGVAK